MLGSSPALAPGARVAIRDEEWMVRTVKTTKYGGYAVHVVGVSELVKSKESIFLTKLDDIQELKPEETTLVHDDSPQYRRSRLYLDALLRRSPATDDALYVGHRAAILPTDYQLQPAAKALRQLRPRILMADGVGLGKTIEVGVLLSELIQRGRGDRILVVALKSILTQFQKELWARFTIPLVRLDSVGIQRVQSRIPSNMNPFYYFDRVIISIDTLKRDEKYRRYLEECQWDVVVVDECQHVAIRGSKSQRARLAQLLGRRSDGLILTSATPHDGRPESFASLMQLLEPTAIADPNNYTSEEVRDLFIRRFKKDVAHEVRDSFCERELELKKEDATPAEDAVFEYLKDIEFKTIARQRRGKGILFRTLLLKAFLSSPAACIATIDNRLGHKDVQDESDAKVAHDRAVLLELRSLIEKVTPDEFKKFQVLLGMLRELGFDKRSNNQRIVIFSERIDTLNFLHKTLQAELKLKKEEIEVFHGTLGDQDQQGLVEKFGTESSPIRILLASDAASEGVNLHYYCHLMVHFDLPWSLITVEQRNGRIDRFGQTHPPLITYLLTIPSKEELKGDLRVLERLIEKEDAAHQNLGDASWLLGLHDAEKEEDRIGRGIEEGETPEEIIPEKEKHTDFMTLFFPDGGPSEPAPNKREPVRLLPSDLDYAREAFDEVLEDQDAHVQLHDHLEGFTLYPPEDLLRRFEYLPSELLGRKNELKLTTDRQRVMDALEQARQDEAKWPEWQLFWEQHPVAEWLDDRVLARFSRHQAPVLRLTKGVEPDERIVLFQGVISNVRSQPAIVEWFGVHFRNGVVSGITPLRELLEKTGIHTGIPNPGGSTAAATLQDLMEILRPAVDAAREHMKKARADRADKIGESVREGVRGVRQWRDARIKDIEEKRSTLGHLHEKRLAAEKAEVEKQYQSRHDWINGVRTAEDPYLRVAAVFIPAGAR